MAESAYSTARGAEISERSPELVLPRLAVPEKRETGRERKIGVKQSDAPYRRGPEYRESSARGVEAPNSTLSQERRGQPLPGDRGRETHDTQRQRPSFWRRIALGRRSAKAREAERPNEHPLTPALSMTRATKQAQQAQQASESIEHRIVEPLLQALVSVESKLERSHIELIGRSDQVEQRLTQLWDIEEQLGTLGELQESLLQISEQQRRLESALVTQNRTLRWLVGAVLFALATAAFVVAAVLQ